MCVQTEQRIEMVRRLNGRCHQQAAHCLDMTKYNGGRQNRIVKRSAAHIRMACHASPREISAIRAALGGNPKTTGREWRMESFHPANTNKQMTHLTNPLPFPFHSLPHLTNARLRRERGNASRFSFWERKTEGIEREKCMRGNSRILASRRLHPNQI